MAIWRTVTFESLEAMIDYMNGAIVGTVNLNDGADVDSKTLKIDPGTGTVTCTFNPPKSRDWTLGEIVAKVEATSGLEGIASVKVVKVGHSAFTKDRRLLLVGDPAIKIIGDGSANDELGFDGPATPANDTDQVITPQAAVERAYRNEDGQDTWTVLLYS